MKLTKFCTMHASQLVSVASTLALAMLLAACGGSGTTPITDATTTPSGLRALPAPYTSAKAVSYSPYRSTTTDAATHGTEVITDAMVEQDLRLLVAGGFGLIRLFDSDDVAVTVMRVISTKNLPLVVHQGIYIQAGNDAFSADEIARGVALAKSYPNIILAVSVGNETMVNWSTTPINPTVMAQHLAYVRSQITQPVTTDDNWAFYGQAPRIIMDTIDFASVHTYSMVDAHYLPTKWDWKQLSVSDLGLRATDMMNAAMGSTRSDYQVVRDFFDVQGYKAMPIVIGETGWKAVDSSGASWYRYLAHPVNQKMYLDRLATWANEGKTGAGPKQVIYFEAFDEPWKGSDDKWGLFNVQRQARYAVQALHTDKSKPDTVVTWNWEPGSYTDADAVYYAPPTIHAAVTQTKYTLYSEATLAASELRETWFGTVRMDAFASSTYPEVSSTAAPGDGTHSIDIGPNPQSYGWGVLIQSNPGGASINLSNFASGNINFSVKTTYAGKLQVGLSSDSADNGPQEAFVVFGNGQYGYCNTGSWCQVSIPVQAFLTANPKLDLHLVLTRFMLADVYATTGNSAPTTAQPDVYLDGVYWQQ